MAIELAEWRLIPPPQRLMLCLALKIQRSHPTEVVANQLVGDGVAEKDLEGISFQKIIKTAEKNEIELPESFILLAKSKVSLTKEPYAKKKGKETISGEDAGRSESEGTEEQI